MRMTDQAASVTLAALAKARLQCHSALASSSSAPLSLTRALRKNLTQRAARTQTKPTRRLKNPRHTHKNLLQPCNTETKNKRVEPNARCAPALSAQLSSPSNLSTKIDSDASPQTSLPPQPRASAAHRWFLAHLHLPPRLLHLPLHPRHHPRRNHLHKLACPGDRHRQQRGLHPRLRVLRPAQIPCAGPGDVSRPGAGPCPEPRDPPAGALLRALRRRSALARDAALSRRPPPGPPTRVRCRASPANDSGGSSGHWIGYGDPI